MSETFVSEPVPFLQIGNRRALTREQIVDDPALADFVERFASSFEASTYGDVLFFIEIAPAQPDTGKAGQ